MSLILRVGIAGALALAPDLGKADFQLNETIEHIFKQGIVNGQADKAYADKFSIAASGTLTLDLVGSLTDVFGLPFTPAELTAIIVAADTGNANNVIVGNDTNHVPIFTAAAQSWPVRPGSLFAGTFGGAGVPVTGGTGDILKLTNSAGGTAVTGKLILIGRSA